MAHLEAAWGVHTITVTPDGDVAIMFLENWKSAATLLDTDMGALVKDMHELHPMTFATASKVRLKGAKGIFPYIFVFYSYEAIDGMPAKCIAKDILSYIEDIHLGKFDIKKCRDKE